MSSSLFYDSALYQAAPGSLKYSLKYAPKKDMKTKGMAARQAALLQPARTRESQNAQGGNATPSFSVFRAGKETIKGAFSPILSMIKHPFKTAVALAGTIALTAAAPITIPFMVTAGIATGGWQVLKGLKTAVYEARQGNYAASEKAFGHIGEGGFGLISSLLGVRQAGSIAAEAKAARLSLSATASAKEKLKAVEQGLDAAVTIQNGSWSNAFKETLSAFSAEGLRTTGAQLNPKRLTQLLVGKLQHWRAQFTESPTVALEGPLAEAQRFLKLKDSEMPEIQQTLMGKEGIDFSTSAHGFYDGKNHSLHVQPDGLKAFRDRLRPSLRKWLDKLPTPVQNFIGNRYKQALPLEEIITHELTHARQFNQVAALTREQALQTLAAKFPGVSLQALENLCNTMRFHGNGTAAMQQAGQRTLTQIAEFRLTQSNLREIQLEGLGKMDAASRLKTEIETLKNYIRAGFEVEARQKAAEAGLAKIAQQLGEGRGLFGETLLLQKYKTLKVEAKLNKLLGQLNSTNPHLSPGWYAQREQQLQHWINLPKQGILTQNYLLHEQKLSRSVQTFNAIIQWTEAVKKAQSQTAPHESAGWGIKFIARQVGAWAKGLLNGIKRFFTPTGLQRFEQKNHSLKGTYMQSAQTLIQSGSSTESTA